MLIHRASSRWVRDDPPSRAGIVGEGRPGALPGSGHSGQCPAEVLAAAT